MSNDTHLPASTADTPALAPSTDPVGAELQRYDEHLRDVQGLSPGTRKGYLRVAGRLLRQYHGGDRLVFAKLQPSAIREFLASELSVRRTPSHARSVAGGLRSYLRYRGTLGDSVGPLTAVITSPAHWTLAHLPQALTREEVARLLDECTAVRRWPKRCYAIVRCALDLGLRAGEIADLLRHCSLRTTQIYAKLDTPHLAEVALPWPGSQS